jgi:hypothetical protein
MSVKDSVYRLDLSDVTEDTVGKIKVVAVNENGQDSREVSFLKLY